MKLTESQIILKNIKESTSDKSAKQADLDSLESKLIEDAFNSLSAIIGLLDDLDSDKLSDSVENAREVLKRLNDYTWGKYDESAKVKKDKDTKVIKESAELEEGMFLEVYYEDGTVTIGTESSSGAEYDCNSREDLKKAFCEYVDNYVGPAEEDDIDEEDN